MRIALRKTVNAAAFAVVLATALPCWGETRPVVRVVLAARGDAPPWFDGFVKHLESELVLRGIDVAVSRGPENAGSREPGVGGPDAVLVVEAPSVLHPVLRFSVTARDAVNAPEPGPGRVREVNLSGVPSDGFALALAVAADELMRSNWPRAVPREAAAATGKEPSAAQPAPEPRRDAGAGSDASGAAANASTIDADRGPSDVASVGRERRGGFAIGAAAGVEVFEGGQTQWGPDLRATLRIAARLEAELRAGWRYVLRQETTNGAVRGDAIVAGAALRLIALEGARARLSFVGRTDVLRVAYRGEARDATVGATDGLAYGWLVSAGPSGSLALTPFLRLEAEVLAGAAPFATTATDAWTEAVSTKGAALAASLGLSLRL